MIRIALLLFSISLLAAPITDWRQVDGALVVIISSANSASSEVANAIAASGNSLVHVLAADHADADVIRAKTSAHRGVVAVEVLPVAPPLPFRDHLINDLVVMDLEKAKAAGFDLGDARRVVTPFGRIIQGDKSVEAIPLPGKMDNWTHRYRRANAVPNSEDRTLDLPLGFKWNAGLPMNFNNPARDSNRYSSTRAMVADDGRLFSFTSAVVENLGATWRSKFGTDQYLVCRDAFNGRLLWKKRVGDTYYGGLYMENTAPLISTGRRLYFAGENAQMIVADTRTGETIRELRTTYIPGVIASAEGIVVAATWKDGKSIGTVRNWDRRRMDWAIQTGTIEAFREETGDLLWRQDLLGTSLLLSDGRVFIVNRSAPDLVEENSGRKKKKFKTPPERPSSSVIALDLKTGEEIWRRSDADLAASKQKLSLESAGRGGVTVAYGNTQRVKLLSAATGNLAGPELQEQTKDLFFRFRNHVCTPGFRVNGLNLSNRGGRISKGREAFNFGGARGACLTGTVPAYGAAFIAQNWCKCSPGQIPGLLAVTSIGPMLTPAEMEEAADPITFANSATPATASQWTSFRGNEQRSSSVDCELRKTVERVWLTAANSAKPAGSLRHDWDAYLNSRRTAASLTDSLAIVGDLDSNEVIALSRETGQVVWRQALGSRVDSAPTVAGRLCLVGDHSGYVSAFDAKTGAPIYTLRIAPEELRMLSYGKVESVWPVIGGVMVLGDKAFGSAGRTQGSDGGLVLRCFALATGKVIWSKAIPQQGEGVAGRPFRNDCILLEGAHIRVMGHRLNAETGDFEVNPQPAAIAAAVAEAKTKATDEKPFDRRAQSEIERQVRREMPATEIGLEGLYSWNWTRLGNRKFGAIGYAGNTGLAAAWDARYAAAVDGNGNLRLNARQSDLTNRGRRFAATHQVTAIILTRNALVLGGLIETEAGVSGFAMGIDLAAENRALTESWTQTFDVPLAFNGLAIDKGDIFATLKDGRIAKLR